MQKHTQSEFLDECSNAPIEIVIPEIEVSDYQTTADVDLTSYLLESKRKSPRH